MCASLRAQSLIFSACFIFNIEDIFGQVTHLLFSNNADYDNEESHQNPQHRQRNRIRTVFTESQVKQLDQLFNITDYPTAEARAQLARNTGLSEETVRVR